MASTMYHNAGTTLLGGDGVYHFVCDGVGCFSQTFFACAALCAVFGIGASVLLLMWTAREARIRAATAAAAKGYAIGGPVGTSQTLADAVQGANLMDSQIEIDLGMLHDDDDTDYGTLEVRNAVGAAMTAASNALHTRSSSVRAARAGQSKA